MPNELKSPTSFLRFTECLYRNESSGGYYALMKKLGKQIRRSLKTTDRTLAERCLRDFREQLTRLDLSKDQAIISFEQLVEYRFDSIKHGLKPKSALRRETCIGQLEKYFKGLGVRQITCLKCDEWGQKLKITLTYTLSLSIYMKSGNLKWVALKLLRNLKSFFLSAVGEGNLS